MSFFKSPQDSAIAGLPFKPVVDMGQGMLCVWVASIKGDGVVESCADGFESATVKT